MTSSAPNNCMFIGLPESGKSSFIGALWHVVESGEIKSSFQVTAQPDDRTYLNELRNNFLNCTANERTKIENMKKIALQIQSSVSGKIVDFLFPDVDGEMYSSQFEFRQLTKEYSEGISQAHSLMIFINPDRLKRPRLIEDAQGVLNFLNDVTSTSNTPALENKPDTVILPNSDEIKWTPKLCQTQVVLVDLLQMIHTLLPKPCKIGIMVSAWDVIHKNSDPVISNMTPEQWIESNLPLLLQYLQSHIRILPFKIFGVSAQGGVYSKNPDENRELQLKMRPSERLIVQEGKSISHDITVPLKWLFE